MAKIVISVIILNDKRGDMNNLTEQERQEVLKILKEMSNGDSSSYTSLILEDYEEIPVDIDTFLHDTKYLGKGLIDNEGRFTVYIVLCSRRYKITTAELVRKIVEQQMGIRLIVTEESRRVVGTDPTLICLQEALCSSYPLAP